MLSLRTRTLELTALLEEVAAQQQPLAAQRALSLTCSAPDGPLEVCCDRDRIAQVLTNLLSNALKFTPDAGRITVSAVRQGDEACIAVANTGEGIAASQLPHIFDRYWQANPVARVGAGLGLSICKAIIDAHQARIWVESVPGEGATIYFTLSLARPGALPSESW
jgi:signal transduction histidine kinase